MDGYAYRLQSEWWIAERVGKRARRERRIGGWASKVGWRISRADGWVLGKPVQAGGRIIAVDRK